MTSILRRPDQLVPLAVRVDASHGGRWTSLRGGGREWLWHRDEPRRARVAPGDGFADAGGLEECVPTVRGSPDHGDAWSRAWTGAGGPGLRHVVRGRDFELTRGIDVSSGAVVADYRLTAEPGFRFVWAGHALLDLSSRARLRTGQACAVFPQGRAVPGPPVAGWRALDRRGLADARRTRGGADARARLRPGAGRRRGLRRHPGVRRGALAADDHCLPPDRRSSKPWIF